MPTQSAQPKRNRAEYSRAYRARKREEKAGSRRTVKRPDSVIRWLETLEVTRGEGAGGPLRLFPWETDWIAGLEAAKRRTVGLVGGLGAAAVAGPRAVPRMLAIGTRPAAGDHWFAKLLQRSGTTYAAD